MCWPHLGTGACYSTCLGSCLGTCVGTNATIPELNVTMNSATPVYHGPNSENYLQLGSVDSGESVTLYWEEEGFYFIECSISNQTKKRGYVPTSTITTTDPVSNKHWTTSSTKFYCLNV